MATTKDKEILASLGFKESTPFQRRPRNREKPTDNPMSQAIAIERVRLGYTQRELAAQVEIGFVTLRRIEQGNEKVQIGLYLKVLQFLGLSVAVSRANKASQK